METETETDVNGALPSFRSAGHIFEKPDSLLSHAGVQPGLSFFQEMQHIPKVVSVLRGEVNSVIIWCLSLGKVVCFQKQNCTKS